MEAVSAAIVRLERRRHRRVLGQRLRAVTLRKDVVLEHGMRNLLEDAPTALLVLVVLAATAEVVVVQEPRLLVERLRDERERGSDVIVVIVVVVLGRGERLVVGRKEGDVVPAVGLVEVLDDCALELALAIERQGHLPRCSRAWRGRQLQRLDAAGRHSPGTLTLRILTSFVYLSSSLIFCQMVSWVSSPPRTFSTESTASDAQRPTDAQSLMGRTKARVSARGASASVVAVSLIV